MAHRLVESLLKQVGVASHSCKVRFHGEEELLKTPFLCEQAAAAALAALGVQASRLGNVDSQEQEVSIDMRAATASIRQERYLERSGEKPPLWDPLSGIYRGGDGRYIQFHCNFPHHRDRVLEVLGIERCEEEIPERSLVEECVAKVTDVFELEEKMFRAGACAAVIRDPAEWAAHDQCNAVRVLPLIEIEEFQPSNGQPRKSAQKVVNDRVHPGGVLEGINCLDFSRVLAGPIAGRTFADFGANVLRVSSPNLPFVEPAVLTSGHGKRAAFLDLEKSTSRQILRDLLGQADIVINAYRPGSMDRFGLSSDKLLEDHAGLVAVELSAYSDLGPWGGKRGFDSLVQCTTGLASEHSSALNLATPSHLPVQLLDYVTGYFAALGAMQALERRKVRPLSSFRVRVSLCRTALWLNELGRKPINGTWMKNSNLPVEQINDLMVESNIEEYPGGGSLRSLDVAIRMTKQSPMLGKGPVWLGSHRPTFTES